MKVKKKDRYDSNVVDKKRGFKFMGCGMNEKQQKIMKGNQINKNKDKTKIIMKERQKKN